MTTLIDYLVRVDTSPGEARAFRRNPKKAMQSAVDSLNAGKFNTAIDQERDALRYLMEARDTILQSLVKQPRAVLRAE